jgi:hypothetical protein
MSRAPRSRLQALILLLVLVLGGMALPGMDAAVFHARGAATGNGSRFDAPDSAGAHSIQCPLAQLLVSGRALAGNAPQTHSIPAAFVALVTNRYSTLESSPLRTPDLPRAPPQPLV